MQKIVSYFFSDFHLKSQTVWFKRLLYVYLIFLCSYFLVYFDLFFGENSIVVVIPKPIGWFKNNAFLLYNSNSPNLNSACILAALAIAVAGLINTPLRFICDFLLWLLILNINNRIYPTLTGGDSLLNQLLIFNCFLSGTFKNDFSAKNQLKVCLHNFALLGIIIQTAVLYFLSALAKLNDPQWISGEAISAISQIRHFSLFSYTKQSGLFFVVLNFVVVFYQLFFPVLVWVKKLKKPFLILGILMHVYISFVMGLLGFGFIMILVYVLFWPIKLSVK